MASALDIDVWILNDDKQAVPVSSVSASMHYPLPAYGLEVGFRPGGFIQVNDKVNQEMLARALSWLAPDKQDQVLDLYCGVGNFTLPLAQQAKLAVGVEGVPDLVEQAKHNAQHNQLDNVAFYHGDLNQDFTRQRWFSEHFTKLILDPARDGAFDVVQRLSRNQFDRIVYVSCNPASMVRDASILLEKGYRLSRACLIDMFPQTGHMECMALFESNDGK